MRLLTFEQWKSKKIELYGEAARAAPLDITCGRCGGLGHYADHGEESGQEFDADCDKCSGRGRLQISPDSDERTVRERATIAVTRNAYESEVEHDVRALADWTGRPAHEVLNEYGFEVWSCTVTKLLRCRFIPMHYTN